MGANESAFNRILEDISVFGKPVGAWIKRKPKNPCPVSQSLIAESPDLEINQKVEDINDKLRQLAEAQITNLDCKTKYNFAFVGNVGVGKSSLINSLRGIDDESDPNFATVGETETTTERKCYVHPKYDHIVLWDFPGGGTQTRPMKYYFFEQKMFAFDHIIIVGAERMTDLDMYIAEEAKKYDVPFDFVRSKSDNDLKNRMKRSRNKSIEVIKEEFRNDVKKDFEKQMQSANVELNKSIYLISTLGFEFDFNYDKKYEMDENTLLRFVTEQCVRRRNSEN